MLAPSIPPVADAPVPDATPAPAAKKQTKAELRALEQQRLDERKAAEAAARQKAIDDKRDAEANVIAEKKAEQDRLAADKLQKERAVREAEVAKRNAEIARKKAEEDSKHDKALADAAARLKQAQAAYQAEMEKAKGIKK